MSTERIDIVVREDGSREVRRNLDELGNSSSGAANRVDGLKSKLGELKGLLAAMGIGAGIAEIVKLTDEWANLQGRLGLVTNSYNELKQVQTELFSISQRTRVDLAGTVDLYTRLSRSTKDLNVTTADRLKVTENINKALIISGASSEEAQRALVQLGQGMSAGVLRGQDLNSVLEQTPRLAQAIAEGLGKTVGDLKKMGEAGTLTAQAVFEALKNQGANLQDEFSRMPQTISQSFTLLKNELLKFVGQAGEANGIAGNFATVLSFVSKNINLIAAALQALTVYKVAEFFLTSAAAAVKKYTALVDAANAAVVERQATIAAAEANVAMTQAQLAVATATQAAVVTSREEQVVRLRQANANIAAAEAAIAAATAAGAQSFALRTLRIATAELAEAEAIRAAALAELATLGQQAARVSAQIAVATEAEAAATTALAGARSAAVAGAGLARGALALLGGPLGAITLALTLGVTAWQLWGSKATQAETVVSQSLAEKTQEILANLDKQIQKLKERNLLAKVDPDLAKQTDSPVAQQKAAVLAEIERVKKGEGQYDFSALSADSALQARTAVLQALGQQYANLSEKQSQATTEQDKLNATLNGDKLREWLDKHQEYMSKTEQLAAAIKEAKKDLGDAFSPEIEKRIKDALSKKDGEHDALLQYKASIDALKQSQKLQQTIEEGSLAHSQAMYDQGNISLNTYMKEQYDAKQAANTREKELVEKQLALATGAGKEQVAARAQYNGELAILAQQRLNNEQEYNDRVAGVFAARKRAEIDAGNAELTGLNDQNKQLEDKIKYFNMLPDAISRATVAELEEQKTFLEGSGFSDPEKIQALTDKITALKRVAGNQTTTQQQEFDYNQIQQFGEAWRRTGDIIGNAMSNAFGRAGQAMGKLVQSYTGLKGQEADLKKQYDDRVKVASGDAKRIADAQAEYANESAMAEAGAYADMASAAKSYFNEKTVAYKVLNGIEQAYRLEQIALAATEMARKIFFNDSYVAAKVGGIAEETAAKVASVAPTLAADTAMGTSAAAVGVATQAAGDPYTAWARMAAMAAVMAGLGFAVSGGHGTNTIAQDRQRAQGTGTVLGDPAKQSESISKSMDVISKNSTLELKYSAGMLSSLKNIESSISGFASQLLQSTDIANPTTHLNTNNGLGKTITAAGVVGAGFAMGSAITLVGDIFGPVGAAIGFLVTKIPFISNLLGKIGTAIFGGKQTLDDSGVTLGSTSLGSVLQNGVNAQTYADITTSGGWFSKDSHDTKMNSVGADANAQFAQIITSMATAVTYAGQALGLGGKDFTDKLNSFVVDIGDISMKGLTGDEIQKKLETAFSKLGDQMAQYALPGLDKFQQVGEGYLQTLVRVATGVEAAQAALSNLGIKAVNYTDIVNKQGDVETELVRQSILVVEHGNGMVDMLKNFGGTAADLVAAYKDLVKVRTLLNNVGLNGDNLSADTLQGAGGLDNLSSGAQDFFKDFFSEAEQHAAGVANLKAQFDKLGLVMPTTMRGFRDLVVSLDDGTVSGNKLVGQVLTLSGAFNDLYGNTSKLVSEAQSDLNDSYNAAVDAITKAQDGVKAFSKTLKDLYASAKLGDLSPLTPGQKYVEAKSQYEQILAAAKAGDVNAQGKYQEAYTAFLNASKTYNMSDSQYQADFNYAQSNTLEAAAWADKQVDVQQQQLDSLNELVKGLVDVKKAVLTIPEAIANLAAAISGMSTKDLKDQINNLYKTFLGRNADDAGSTYFQAAIAKGSTIDQVSDSIKNSPEAQIRQLYQSLLHRNADDAGLAYYVNAMNSGTSIKQIEDAIKSSNEYLTQNGGISYGSMSGVETPPTAAQAAQQAAAIAAQQADNKSLTDAVQALREDQAAQTDAIITALLQSSQTNAAETVEAIKTSKPANTSNFTVAIQ